MIDSKLTNADIECWRTFREFRVLSIKSNLHIFGAYDIPRAYLCRISRSWKYDSNSVLRPILSLRVLTLALMFTLMHSHTAHLSDKLQIFLKLQKFLKFSLKTPWKNFKIFKKGKFSVKMPHKKMENFQKFPKRLEKFQKFSKISKSKNFLSESNLLNHKIIAMNQNMMKKKSEYFKCRTFSTEIFQSESIFSLWVRILKIYFAP